MKPREPLCLNRESRGVDWLNQQYLQELATVATLEGIADRLTKSDTSTLTQYFSYACAGVGFYKTKALSVLYITHVKLLRSVDVFEFIHNKVLQQLLLTVASLANCKEHTNCNLMAHPPGQGTVHLSDPLRAGATPNSCQSQGRKYWVVAVVVVVVWLSQVNAHG
jgi:hypothetical protein